MGGEPIVEATAGAVGTMVTCVLLYPVDIAKLRMQVSKSRDGAWATIKKIVAEDSFGALYKGLPTKAVHVPIAQSSRATERTAPSELKAVLPSTTPCGLPSSPRAWYTSFVFE